MEIPGTYDLKRAKVSLKIFFRFYATLLKVRFLHALLQALGLGVLFVTLAVSLSVKVIGQVDNHLPLAVSVHGSLRSAVENVGRANVTAVLVVVFGVGVAAKRGTNINRFACLIF